MTGIVAAPLAWEDDAAGRWIGALPGGPILHVNAVGELVLGIVQDAEGPVTVEEIAAEARRRVPDAPASVLEDVTAFVAALRAAGVVHDAPAAAAREGDVPSAAGGSQDPSSPAVRGGASDVGPA